MNRSQQAVAAFESGFNCSQAILRSYGSDYGLSPLHALQVASGFGGGMRRGDTCGAVTGALMVLGLRYGPQDTPDKAANADVYSKIADFCSKFESRCGSVVCRDLLGCDLSTPEGLDHAKSKNLFRTICPKMVEAAADLLGEMLGEDP